MWLLPAPLCTMPLSMVSGSLRLDVWSAKSRGGLAGLAELCGCCCGRRSERAAKLIGLRSCALCCCSRCLGS